MQGVVQSAPQAVDAMAFAGTRSTAARETARVVDDYDYGMDDDEGYGVTAYDSDEEADYSKMDRGASAKRTQLTRFDFDTEEEFAAYKDSQEAAPKYGAAVPRSLGGPRPLPFDGTGGGDARPGRRSSSASRRPTAGRPGGACRRSKSLTGICKRSTRFDGAPLGMAFSSPSLSTQRSAENVRAAASQIIRDQYNRPDFAGFGVDSKGGGGGGGGGSKGKGYGRRAKATARLQRVLTASVTSVGSCVGPCSKRRRDDDDD